MPVDGPQAEGGGGHTMPGRAVYLTLIAALARNRAIGVHGGLPWHLPDDFRFFKSVTLGKPVIMGRRTFESIGVPLPGRQNIVVTRNRDWIARGVETAQSLDRAIAAATGREAMIIGGGQLYELALPRASRLLLTVVDCEPEADTFFPQWQDGSWSLAGAVPHPADERHAFAFEMQEWVRGGGKGAP